MKRRPCSGYMQSRTFFCAATFPDPDPNVRKRRPGVMLESKKLGRCCLEQNKKSNHERCATVIVNVPRSSSMCPVRAGKSSRAGHVRGQFFPPLSVICFRASCAVRVARATLCRWRLMTTASAALQFFSFWVWRKILSRPHPQHVLQ